MCRSDALKLVAATFVAGAASTAFASSEARMDVGLDSTYQMFGVAQNNGAGSQSTDCYWDNGAPGQNPRGQSSEQGTAVNNSQAWDDFCIEPANVLKVDAISADFLTNSSFGTWAGATAVLEIYADCDGCPDPGRLIATAFDPQVDGADSTPDGDGFRKVTYTFEFFILNWTPRFENPTVEPEILDEIVLDGGCGGACYWVSVIHIGDGSWMDRGFWCATEKPDIKAAQAVAFSEDFMIPPPTQGDCTRLEDTNIGKGDLVFCVYGENYEALKDNGNCATTGQPSALDTSLPSSRAADQFVTRPDVQGLVLSVIEVCMINNCDPNRTFVELWTGDCYPESRVAEIGKGLEIDAAPIVDRARDQFGNELFSSPDGIDIWKLTYCLPNGFPLEDCTTYWVAAVGKGTGAFGEKAYFAFNEDCKSKCLVMINEAYFLKHPNPEWLPVSSQLNGEKRDLAFAVYVETTDEFAEDPTPETNGNKPVLQDLREAINAIQLDQNQGRTGFGL